MATSQHTAEVVVRGNTEGASKSLKGLADDAGKAKRAVDAAGDSGSKFGDKLDAVEKKLGGLSSGLSRVTGLLGAGALIGAAMGAAQAIGEMADRAGQLTAANQALKISINGARNATAGMVSDFDLTLAANKAVQLGVVKSETEFAKLASAATKLGMSLGQDAAKSVDDLTVALGRQSFEILDNLGIVLKQSEANEIWAQRLGKAADKLTDAEKKQGFMTIALERAEEAAAKSNVTLETSANKVAALSAKWQNLKDAVSSAVVEGIATAIDPSAALADGMGKLNSQAQALAENSHTLQDRLIAYTDKTNGAAGATVNFLAQLSLTNEELGKFQRASLEEQNLALAKERFLEIKKEEAERRKSMVLAERERDLNADALEISKKKAKVAKEISASDPKSRDISFEASIGATHDISEAARARQNAAAFAIESAARRERLDAINGELEVMDTLGVQESEQIDMVLWSMEVESEAEEQHRQLLQERLDLEVEYAAWQEENALSEDERARARDSKEKSLHNRYLARLREEERQTKKSQLDRVAVTQHAQNAISKVTEIGLDAAEMAMRSEKDIGLKALSAMAEAIKQQAKLKVLFHAAEAIGAFASYRYAAGAQHLAAAAAWGVLAAGSAAGQAAADKKVASNEAEREAQAKEAEDADKAKEKADKKAEKADKKKSEKASMEGGDDDGVPTSYYDADLWTKRPDRQGRRNDRSHGSVTVHATVLGSTKEEVGIALKKLIIEANRSNPGAARGSWD